MINFLKIILIITLMVIYTDNTIAIPKVIFDTDIANVDSTGHDRSDIDDLGALAILNALSNIQLCEIIGIVAISRSDKVVEMIDAVNTYYGNPGIPIGLKEGNDRLIEDKNGFAKHISGMFEHTQRTIHAPTSTELLRRVLSGVSVTDTVIYIHADNISNWNFLCISTFLASGPDNISPLTGYELLNSKVDKLISYIPCLPNNNVSENCPDWCDKPTTDAPKLQYFLDNFQNTLIGNSTAVEEAHLPTKLWEQPDDNPVKIAYQYYYSKTPPPWRPSTDIPESISIYGDGLGIIYLITQKTSRQLFNQVDSGGFVLDKYNKLQWSATDGKGTHSYFYTVPELREQLWKMIDELICSKPI